MVKAKKTTTMAHQQGTNRISKSAKLEAARERARVAMEADLAKVEALQRKNTACNAGAVRDTSRPSMAAKTASQGYQLGVATTRLDPKMDSQRSQTVDMRPFVKNETMAYECARNVAAVTDTRHPSMAAKTASQGYQLQVGTTRLNPKMDSQRSPTFEMRPFVKNDTMVYECASPQCRRVQRAIAKERAREADAARAYTARLYQAILFLSLILVAVAALLMSGHDTTQIGEISEHGRLSEISKSRSTVTVLPHSTTNPSKSKHEPAALPDPQTIACSSVCRIERGLQSNLSGGWTLLMFALEKVVGIAWSCIYDYPSLSFGAILLWLLRRSFYQSSYRSRMFGIAAQGIGGIGWTCLSIYPRHTSAVLALLVLVVLAVKIRRSY
jgi:hypothetical protein